MSIIRLICTSAILTLAACSGGGSGSGGGDAAQSALFFGSTDPTASASGLAFADENSELNDLDGQTTQVRMIRFINDNQTGETRFEITDETATFSDLPRDDFTISFGGETIIFTDSEGIRANGVEIETFDFAGSENEVSGEVSTVFSVVSYVDNQNDVEFGENTEGVFAIGFETNPDVVQALTGQVNYSGDFGGFGLILGPDGSLEEFEQEFVGSAEFVADFGSNTISGGASLSLDVDNDPTTDPAPFPDTNLTLAPTAITGNGFAGSLACADPSACTSDSQIAGAFYGNNAQELTGVTALDLTDGDGTQFIANGGFVTTPSPN